MAADLMFSIACLRGGLMLRAALLAILLNPFAMAQDQEFSRESEESFAELEAQISAREDEFCSPEASKFDQWEGIVDESPTMVTKQELSPFDWMRHVGFRHSSTHGRNVGKGVPMEGRSWLNRPYHVDWFLGPLLGDDLITNRVSQDNVLFGGLRLGWDFDYYWGIEWRLGWASPNASFAEPLVDPVNVSYVVSDVDVLYYPWGDSKVRPYLLWGLGATQLDFRDDTGFNRHATLATMPFGAGVQFHPVAVARLAA